MSKGFEGIGWLWRRIDPIEGPGMWHHSVNAELMSLLRDRDDHDVRELAFADETRQLAEQRAELLEALQRAADTVERDDLDTPICCDGRDCGCMGSSNRQLFVHELRALVERIANATQQRNATGGEG